MRLHEDQLIRYATDGFLLTEALFGAEDVAALRAAFLRDCETAGPHRFDRADGSVAAMFGSHLRQPEIAALVRRPELVLPARALLGSDVYVYQVKISTKPAFEGGGKAWHQDFAAWRLTDGVPAPRLLNAAVLLDPATAFNGPLLLMAGSHTGGVLPVEPPPGFAGRRRLDANDVPLAADRLAAVAPRYELAGFTGSSGSVMFYGAEIIHGSGPNMSAAPRTILVVTYNATGNAPPANGRPGYLVGADPTPLSVP